MHMVTPLKLLLVLLSSKKTEQYKPKDMRKYDNQSLNYCWKKKIWASKKPP